MRSKNILLLLIALAISTVGKADSGGDSSNVSLPYYTDSSFTPNWEADPSNHRIAPFSFTDQEGKTIANTSLSGKIYVANFFFTTCPGICAKMRENLRIVQSRFANNSRLAFLSHSVTPSYDTVDRLASYAEKHDIPHPQWKLLTGSKEEIYAIARQSYFADEQGEQKGSDAFLHTEKLMLIDHHGCIRGVYNGVMTVDMKRLISDIETLLEEQNNPL